MNEARDILRLVRYDLLRTNISKMYLSASGRSVLSCCQKSDLKNLPLTEISSKTLQKISYIAIYM